MSRRAVLRFVWPAGDARAVEIELYAARGTLRLAGILPPTIGMLRTPTRLRIEILEGPPPPYLDVPFTVEGESPLPPVTRLLTPVLDELATLPQEVRPTGRLITLADIPASRNNAMVVNSDLLTIDECRRFYSEGDDFVARARKLFYKIDQQTHKLWVPTEPFLPLVGQLQVRLDLHMDPPAVPGALPGLTAQQHEDVWDVFKDAAAHLTPEEELTAYLWFAAGLLEHKCPHLAAAAGPDSANILLIMELAFDALENATVAAHDHWLARLPTLIYMVEIFGRRLPYPMNLSMIEPALMRPSYAVGPVEIEADRAAFVTAAEADPTAEAMTTVTRYFIMG